MNENFKEGLTEVLDILKYMDKSYVEKIPKKFMQYMEENKSETYIPNIDHTRPFEEAVLKEETKNILATIYLNYWCNPEEKEVYKRTLDENEKKYYQEMQEKYNPDNLFKNEIKNEKKIETQENNTVNNIQNTEMIEYKESFFKKIFNRIRELFIKG